MKKNLLKLVSFISLTTLFPFLAFAASTPLLKSGDRCAGITGLSNIMCRIGELLGYVIPVLVALGVVYFVWGVVQYVIGDSEEAKKKGRDRMIFGIVGLVVIVAVWGLVAIILRTFGLDEDNVAPTTNELQNLLPK